MGKKQEFIIYLEKTEKNYLLPVDRQGADDWVDITVGLHKVTFTKEEVVNRKYYRHKAYFKMLRLAFRNQDKFQSEEGFRKAVIIEAGFYHYEHRFNINNPQEVVTQKVADSMSYASMNQEEFEVLYKLSVDVVMNAFKWGDEMYLELMSFL